MENGNQPINPINHSQDTYFGLTKREHFAIECLKSISHSCFGSIEVYHMQLKDWEKKYGKETKVKTAMVLDSIEIADELLKQLEK